MSAIKTKLSMHGVSVVSFSNPRLRYFNRSVARNANLKVNLKSIVDISILTQIVQVSDSMYMCFVYKAAILLSFFSFVRVCNLIPHSISTYQPLKQLVLFIYLGFYIAFNTVQVISRWVVGRGEETSTYSSSGFCTVNCRPTASNYQLSHLKPCREPNQASEVGGENVTTLPPWPPLKQLARGDVFFAAPGAGIVLKWPKTLQMNNYVRQIKDKWVPLSDTRLRKQFATMLARLHLHYLNITFHSFRHSGATWAFNAKLPLQNIQSHGTWMSECVGSYITQDHQASDAVALTFQRFLHS